MSPSVVISSSYSQVLPLLSSNFTMDEEAKLASEKQGIVSILLGGSCSSGVGGTYTTTTNSSTPPPSLRRTLSADMSSRKWLQAHHNCFSSSVVKKISSSHQLLLASIHDHDHDHDHHHHHHHDGDSSSSASDDDDDEDEKERLNIWNSIQDAKTKENSFPPKEKEKEEEIATSWISILSPQKKHDSDSKPLPPPYVHPLLKRSASALSQKSLEICTESLGSETGSDHGFSTSSYLSSEASSDAAEDDNLLPMPPREEESYLKYNGHYYSGCSSSKKAKKAAAGHARSFPPPLPSLSGGDNGNSLSMRSSRNNGRLVLEAVSVSSQNNFQAQRTKGRLILTFVDRSTSSTAMAGQAAEIDVEEAVVEDEENNGNSIGEVEVEGLEKEAEEETDLNLERLFGAGGMEFSAEKALNLPTTGVMNLHNLAALMMMNKPIVLPNRIPKWAMSKFDDVVVVNKCKDVAEEEEEVAAVQQSLLPLQSQVARMIPTPPPASAASSFNAYEYFWRTKSTTASSVSTNTKKQPLSVSALKSYGNNNNNNNNCSTVPKNNSSPSWRNYYTGGGGAPIGIGKSCNEPRKCLFFWEANCIATSS